MSGFVIFAVVLAVSIGWSLYANQLRKQAWTEVASSLGLEFDGVRIVGMLDGHPVVVETVTRGSGKNRTTFTKYTVGHRTTGPSVRLTKQGRMRFLLGVVGMDDDVVIGDDEFDARVVVRAPETTSAGAFLTPARRTTAIHLFERYLHAEIDGAGIEAERRGVERDAGALTMHLRWLVDASEVFSEPASVDVALEPRVDGDPGASADALHAWREEHGDNRLVETLEAEARLAAGDPAGARRAIEHLDDDELAAWSSVAEAELAATASDRAAIEPPVSPVPAEVDSVIADLFSSHRMGHETEAHFDATHRGRPVQWSGTVDRVSDFHYHSVFDGPGRRVRMVIGELGDGRLISRAVTAEVHLDDDRELRRGDLVTVDGRLVALDRYVRTLFVDDGVLVAHHPRD